MGQIRNYQTDYLRQGSEPITYERYDSEGVFIETINEDILYECPKDLTPLNKDLVKSFERPLKKVEFITDLTGNYFINENAHFLYGDRHWGYPTSIVSGGAGNSYITGNVVEIITDDDKVAKAISGNKYMRSNVINTDVDGVQMIANDREQCIVKVRQKLQIQFDYYIETTGSNENWLIPVKFYIQKTYAAGVPDYMYDFQNNEFVTYNSDERDVIGKINTKTVNSWGKASFTIEGYQPTEAEDDIPLEQLYAQILICFPRSTNVSTGGFQNIFIDNVRISEYYDVENTIVSRRKQYDYNGRTYTGEYKSEKNILSNEAQTTDYFIGKINGYFRRKRDTADKTLEQIITQEIINDSRDYMTKYEGTFRGGRDGHLSLHNKLWIDFGADLLQEPVSCYLDAMKYDVKASEYQIRMHVPNQDDDVGSTYNVYVE